MPDVFIDQAKALRIPTYYTKPASLRVYNDSTIRYSSRQIFTNKPMMTSMHNDHPNAHILLGY